jgi:3-hydroxyisobutyrate dehydrogenase-like beta-hydroxyacid dehydrogenase
MADRIGMVGVGAMGAAMWRRMRDLGVTATVYDVSDGAVAALTAEGALPAGNPGDVAANADVLLVSVPRSEDVIAAVSGPGGVTTKSRPGLLVIDLTSGAPSLSRQVAETLAAKGAAYIDAGVSGGVQGARSGALRIMVGADDDAFARARPVLELIGSQIWHCGDVGAGHAMKTVLNLANQVKMVAEVEALLVASKAGLDPRLVGEVCGMGAWNSWLLGPEGRRRFDFTMRHMCKDFDVALGLATERGVPVPVSAAAQHLLRGVLGEFADGEVDPDIIDYVGVLERRAGTHLTGA